MYSRTKLFTLAGALLACASSAATTVRPMSFDHMAKAAELIVIGTVVDQHVVVSGADIYTRRDDQRVAPPERDSKQRGPEDDEQVDDAPAKKGQAISEVEGGLMIFTEITMEVEEGISGAVGSTLKFRVAGGDDGFTELVVHGMPTFEIGGRYLLFMSPRFEEGATPVIGVDQGFFQIVEDPESGDEVLRNAGGSMVAGVEDGRLRLARGEQRSERRLGPPPKPEAGSNVTARTSPEVLDYWNKELPPISIGEFIDAIYVAQEQE